MKKLTKESMSKLRDREGEDEEEDEEEEEGIHPEVRIRQIRSRERSRQKQYLLKRREEFRSTANTIIAMMGSRHRAVVDAKEMLNLIGRMRIRGSVINIIKSLILDEGFALTKFENRYYINNLNTTPPHL